MDEINGSFEAVWNAEGRTERGYLFLKLKFPSSDCARARKKNYSLHIRVFGKQPTLKQTKFTTALRIIIDSPLVPMYLYRYLYQYTFLSILSLRNLQRRRYRYWLEMISISIPSSLLNCLLRFALLRDLPFITSESYVLLGIRIPDSGQVWFILELFHSLFSSIVI